jgi:tetratricopeptide (TPR) repeat protein
VTSVRTIAVACGLAGALMAGAAHAQSKAKAPEDDVIIVTPQANGRWLRAESDHVIVYSNEGPEVLRRVVSDLEALDQTLRGLYPRSDGPSPRKYPIYLVKSVDPTETANPTYRRFLPGAPVSSLSMNVAEPDDIFAVVVRDNFRFFNAVDLTAGDDSVLGAYALHFFSEAFPFRQPRWLIKGAAIYYSAIDIKPDKVVIGDTPALFDRTRVWSSLGGLADVIAETGAGESAPNRRRFDERAAVLVSYLWADPVRKARLDAYLRRVEAGERDLRAAWTQIFGEPPEKLEPWLMEFVRQKPILTTIPRPAGPPPTIRIRALPAGAEDLILEIQQLKAGTPSANRDDLLRKFRKAAARRPAERYTRQALARAEITIGDRDAGEKLLEELLAEDGGNLEALRLMGTSKLYRAAADRDHRAPLLASARGYLEKADAAEPNDYQTLFLLAQTMATDEVPSPERLALLRRAVTLAPEVPKIRLVAAVAFLTAADTQTAFQLLKPMAADPNGGEASRQAQRVLELLETYGAAPGTP